MQLAQLIKGGANVRVATIGMGGYDTHEGEGVGAGGYLFGRLNELARAMDSFFADLGPLAADVTVMVSSEFGRRVAQNGSGHGPRPRRRGRHPLRQAARRRAAGQLGRARPPSTTATCRNTTTSSTSSVPC